MKSTATAMRGHCRINFESLLPHMIALCLLDRILNSSVVPCKLCSLLPRSCGCCENINEELFICNPSESQLIHCTGTTVKTELASFFCGL